MAYNILDVSNRKANWLRGVNSRAQRLVLSARAEIYKLLPGCPNNVLSLFAAVAPDTHHIARYEVFQFHSPFCADFCVVCAASRKVLP